MKSIVMNTIQRFIMKLIMGIFHVSSTFFGQSLKKGGGGRDIVCKLLQAIAVRFHFTLAYAYCIIQSINIIVIEEILM